MLLSHYMGGVILLMPIRVSKINLGEKSVDRPSTSSPKPIQTSSWLVEGLNTRLYLHC